MSTPIAPQHQLIDFKVNINLKLAALWASLMFLYIYVDYFHLYMPGSLKDMLAGKVYVFSVTQTFLTITLISMSIPALMIFLSVSLSPRINRYTNSIVALVYIPYTLFNLAGEAWIHMYVAAAIEVFLLGLIIRLAWQWPRTTSHGITHNEN